MSASYTLKEIAENNGKNGKPVWIIIKGGVYDMTTFAAEHPGGAESILEFAGKDSTKAFNAAGHSTDAIKDMKKYKIGVVAAAVPPSVIEAKVKNSIALQKQLESEQSATGNQKRRIKLFFCF